MSWGLPEYIEATPQNTKTPFKYNVGETVHTPSSDLYIRMQVRIPDGINSKTRRIQYKKGYIYQCENCKFIGVRKETTINSFDCPVCSGHSCKWNYNSIAFLKPAMIHLFANIEDAYEYTLGSHRKVDFICPDCGALLKEKQIKNVIKNGLYCSYCSDGVSIGEKIFREVLLQLNIPFEMHRAFEWSRKRTYDFYLPECKMVIEIHGVQHNIWYNESFASVGGRTTEEEHQNDLIKEKLAENHGLEYVWIDASKSEFNHIKCAIMGCIFLMVKYPEKFLQINWEEIEKKSKQSMVIMCGELWNDQYSSNEIRQITHYSSSAINYWLQDAQKIGLCHTYNKAEANRRNGRKIINTQDMNVFWSAKDCGKYYCIPQANAYSRARNNSYNYMFFDNYVIKNNISNSHEFFKEHLVQEVTNNGL